MLAVFRDNIDLEVDVLNYCCLGICEPAELATALLSVASSQWWIVFSKLTT